MDEHNDSNTDETKNLLAQLPSGAAKWVPSISGGLAGAIATVLFIVIPTVNTWLANTKEVSLAQIKNTAEQIAYITQRMQDSDKERDLYKAEMLKAQQELRECRNEK
jgi:hypothetical protein